ncbi:MAG: sigma-70 family RNA polymerase sigma factor [Myxococcota bacterium]
MDRDAPLLAAPFLAASSQDDTEALERLYLRHRHDVYRIALRYGGGRSGWAEDVVQDVFMRLGRALPGLEDRGALMGWLYRVTTRRCLNRLESERVRALFRLRAPKTEPLAPSTEAIVEAQQALAATLQTLETLPPKERVAFAMHRLDGMTMDEIGAVMGHKKSYVCRLIARAEARLREVLK